MIVFPHRKRFVLALLLGGALVLGLPACDSDDAGDARFCVRFSDFGGSEPCPLEGRARFSTSEDGRFVIGLPQQRSGIDEGLVLARAGGSGDAVPGAQRYAFAFPDGRALPGGGAFAGALRVSFGGSVPALYYAQPGGSLDLTERSGDAVRGSFQFRAQRIETGGSGSAPLSIVVEGRFRAERGATDNFPFTGGS